MPPRPNSRNFRSRNASNRGRGLRPLATWRTPLVLLLFLGGVNWSAGGWWRSERASAYPWRRARVSWSSAVDGQTDFAGDWQVPEPVLPTSSALWTCRRETCNGHWPVAWRCRAGHRACAWHHNGEPMRASAAAQLGCLDSSGASLRMFPSRELRYRSCPSPESKWPAVSRIRTIGRNGAPGLSIS